MIGQMRAAFAKLVIAGQAQLPLSRICLQLTCPNVQQVRSAVTGFNSHNSDQLWKSISVVSKNGARRGRGKKVNARVIKDLYRNQVLGDGKVKMVWPGLNTSVVRGRQIVQQEKLDTPKEDPNEAVREAKEEKLARRKLHPLDRGFSSANICGRNLKNTTNLELHKDFDFRVVDNRNVCHMTGLVGRYQTAAVVVACGNGNGLIGLGAGKSMLRLKAVQKASTRAMNRLVYIERHNNHTVLHDFFSHFYATKVFVSRKPEGHGLKCHRVIALICKLAGIKDIHVKVEGSTMPMNVAKAFVLGLVRQKTYQDLAEDKKLHVVEFDSLRRNFPNVLASPTVCRKNADIPTTESLDFTQHALDGRVRYVKPRQPPFFTKLKGWEVHLKKEERSRGYRQNLYELTAKYGETRSFLADKYPEARQKNKIYKF
ncbi:hypothetical protein ONE63_007165 [Megalurothrips usitatus]|uniref:Small ribosomal subunit protein uS5m n=1 Tax=Megalurothrips usitatus TaxID=439358 RepID=A0AAV7XR65_9NEOP|nr:hypothetical protein ONE63_007165 [Megalurothrips usitatus]